MKTTTLSGLAVFTLQALQVSADSSVCSSGIYAALAPLDNYAPAVSYCQGQAGKATVTVTVSANAKRQPATATTATSGVTASTLKTSTTKMATDAKAASWSSLVAQAKSVVATFCSCAGYPATVTTSTTLKPVSTCNNGFSGGSVCTPTPSADYGHIGTGDAAAGICGDTCASLSNYGQGCVGYSLDASGECFLNVACCVQQ